MKRILLAKEWTGIRPYAWLMLALSVNWLVGIAIAGLSDLHFKHTLIRYDDWTSEGFGNLVFAFALGTSLLVREIEDGTQAFLDGLPLTRRDVFLAKLAVAGTCVFAFSILGIVTGWLLHRMLHHSADEVVPAATLAALALRSAVLVAVGLGFGMLCGFLRNLAWALFAAAAAAVVVLEKSWPRVGMAIDPARLVADGWSTHGYGGANAWTAAGLALACLVLAHAVYARAGGAGMGRLARLAERRAFAVLVYGGAIALVAGAVAAWQAADRPSGDIGSGAGAADAPPPAPAAHTAARKVVTNHYTFNVPTGLAVEDRELRAADGAFATACRALVLSCAGVPRIDVDLSGSIRNTDGLAGHLRVRVNLKPGWNNTLVHETVHVLADWVVGTAHRTELGEMTVFNEGLARWAEPDYRTGGDEHVTEEMALAITFQRRQIAQDMLFDARAMAGELDMNLKYPLGAGLIGALATRYGAAAPARVLGALNSDAFPRDLHGEELYRTAFQLAGYDLALVLNDHALALRALERTWGWKAPSLPRPRGLLVREGGRFGMAVQAEHPAMTASIYVVRFRPRDDSSVEQLAAVRQLEQRGGRLVAWVPPAQVAAGRICYQIGVNLGGTILYEPWSCLPLDAAAPAPAAPAASTRRP